MSGSWEDYYFTGRRVGSGIRDRPMFEGERRAATQQEAQRNTGQYFPTFTGDTGLIHGAYPNQDALGAAQMDQTETYRQFRETIDPLTRALVYGFVDGNESEIDATINQIHAITQRPVFAPYAAETEQWLQDWNSPNSRNIGPRVQTQ